MQGFYEVQESVGGRVESTDDAVRRLKALLRLVVDAACKKRELSRTSLAEKLGLSASSFSKIVNAAKPIEPDRIVKLLEDLGASPDTIRSSVLLAYAANAEGKTCAKYFLDSANWVFAPDNMEAEAKNPRNILINGLNDMMPTGDSIDSLLAHRLMEDLGVQPIGDVGRAAAEIARLSAQNEIPKNLFDAVDGMSLKDIRHIFDRYSDTLTVDFSLSEVVLTESGTLQQLVETNTFDFMLAQISPNRIFSHDAHKGIHILVVLRGDCALGQWDKAEGRSARHKAFELGVRLSEQGRRIAVFDGSQQRHGIEAGGDGADVVVILLKPRLGLASITQLTDK